MYEKKGTNILNRGKNFIWLPFKSTISFISYNTNSVEAFALHPISRSKRKKNKANFYPHILNVVHFNFDEYQGRNMYILDMSLNTIRLILFYCGFTCQRLQQQQQHRQATQSKPIISLRINISFSEI